MLQTNPSKIKYGDLTKLFKANLVWVRSIGRKQVWALSPNKFLKVWRFGLEPKMHLKLDHSSTMVIKI